MSEIIRSDAYVEKRLSPRERTEPEAISRVRSEIALLTALSATGVVPRLIEHGEDARGPWHRTERLPFPTLADRIEEGARIEPAWVERAVRSAFEALAILHEARDDRGPLHVVHADLSPSNIAMTDDGSRALLLDLDLASWRDGPPRSDGTFRGTLVYVAPEVARGDPPTAESDLFAMAASLLHVATGAPPRPNEGMIFAALLATAAETPLLRPEHEALASRGRGHAAILRCLAHEPAERPTSARDVLALLEGA
jgi:serine/threonine protein kinase